MTKMKERAARQERYNQRRKAADLVQIRCWYPAEAAAWARVSASMLVKQKKAGAPYVTPLFFADTKGDE